MSPTSVTLRDADHPTDAQLLARFVGERYEPAFALLVRRYAGLVYGVCRRVLRNPADADDAFQAVFLVLFRKAGSLAVRSSLGDWLHAVAVRVAMKARTAAARRHRREQVDAGRRTEAIPPAPAESLDWFDREPAALPVRYREPVVLCLMQERSREQAAAVLGIPEGTLASRLAYARRWLADRLTRRGIGFPSVFAAVVPAALISSATAQAGGVVSPAVHQLATGAMRAMLFTKLRVGVLAAVGLAVLAGGGLLLAAPDDKPTEKPQAKAPAEKEPEWMPAFRKAYQLADGEYVKRVAPPFVPERDEYMYSVWNKQKQAPEDEEKIRTQLTEKRLFFVLLMEYDGEKLTRRTCVSVNPLHAEPKLRNGDNTMTVWDAVSWVTGLDSPALAVHTDSKGHFLFSTEERRATSARYAGWPTVSGDFVIRKGAPLDKLVPQLEKILRDECDLEVRLTLKEEEQEVYVVGGAFKLTPPEWREPNGKLIDLYATDDGLNKEFDPAKPFEETAKRSEVSSVKYSGTPADFVTAVGLRVNRRMVWDKPLADTRFSWVKHTLYKPTGEQEAEDRDPEMVLKHATEQTGLTFKKEKRKVPVLYLSASEK